MHSLLLSCPKGLEGLLSEEAQTLGASHLGETVGGVRLAADLETVYRICLWSRLANRVYCR